MQQKWNQNFDGEPMTDIPQKFLNAGCDVYMVMQLRHDEKILDERFASMRELHRRGKTPDPEHYEVTYYADLPAMWQDVPNNEILEAHHMEKGRRLLQDYDAVMDKVAEAEELGLDNRPSTLEKLAELASTKEKCDAPECNPTVCRKVRDAHEL